MKSGDPEEYLSVRETALILQVHENTVRIWAANGVLVSSKLPGTKFHRFARTEVERVLRDRGANTSSVARSLRTDGPELVGPIDLDQWAARNDAKVAFPELMDRLLAATPGVTNVNVRSHEGTSAHGWDGTATSHGSKYLPDGNLYFEFGTDALPHKKATSDYRKREDAIANDPHAIFIFATPKNWPGAKAWSSTESENTQFSAVEAFDSHRLVSWLRETPSVHYWLSERLGYNPRDASTLSNWWVGFRSGLTLELPASFFLAGRQKERVDLTSWLTSADSSKSALPVKASSESEACAFIYGALQDTDLLASALVVRTSTAWARLIHSTTPLILVPKFDQPDVTSALSSNHRVLLPADLTQVITSSNIALPRIEPISAAEAIDKTSTTFAESRRIVKLARRDMQSFLRTISKDPRQEVPAWTRDSTRSDILARLILTSTWSNESGDHEAIELLTSKSWIDIQRVLLGLHHDGYTVFIPSGNSWQLSDPIRTAQLLLPRLTTADIDIWRNSVEQILLTADPYEGMDSTERIHAMIKGVRPQFSSELRHGVALSLAMASASGVSIHGLGEMDQAVEKIVANLFSVPSGDRPSSTWLSISSELPLIAEAAPNAFLDAVEEDLARREPLLADLFEDQTSDSPFGSSSTHTELLWALETLCWSPDYFHRSATALAQLARIDPGGTLSNRPPRSLINVMCGWARQCGAKTKEKIALLRTLSNSMPDTMWPILIGLLPETHGIVMPPHAPTYKNWTSEESEVFYDDWSVFTSGVVRIATEITTGDPVKWAQLVDKYENLPPHLRTELLQSLLDDLRSPEWSTTNNYDLWRKLDEVIRRHEEFAEAEWAMGAGQLDELRKVADAVASDHDPRRHAALFEWRSHFGGLNFDDEGFDQSLQEARRSALSAVLSQGIEALESLASIVENANAFGWELAAKATGELDDAVLGWLVDHGDALRSCALAYLQERLRLEGWNWIEHMKNIILQLEPKAQSYFANVLPFSEEYWSRLDELTPAVKDAYWSRPNPYLKNQDEYLEAADRLLESGHPWGAASVVSHYMHDDARTPDVSIVKRVLAELIQASEPMPNQSMSPYFIEQLIKFLERTTPDDPELIQFEFVLFGLLHDNESDLAIYRALSSNPANFVAIIRSLYRSEHETIQVESAAHNRAANRSYEILHHWNAIPGQRADGSVDFDKLQDWVRAARIDLEESGHASIGDEQIGEMLSASPLGSDGIWPAEGVREIIEAVGSVRLESGLQVGLFNRRGITVRAPFEGGAQERALQERYLEMSKTLSPVYFRTSRLLREIAASYGQDALREDSEAERDADRE
ncbi:helix-turn-helix domain-containing protein [Rathayibacter sp. AY1C1]|uniref:helix-turn-helix domain-containing protein n=1 Tax=Rathayibacter sp. AY1C1 TaxID=2080534 RepID=UPI0011B01712|nr:helix-turn-helix domain-containing protein [Rathayibacter sp. AY1C1]